MISVVVPIYNEEPLIERLHSEITAAMDATNLPWEAVYVNDGSRDRSLELLLACQEHDARTKIVELSRNWGHQSALTAGLTESDGEAVVLIDGDLQDPPALIPELVASWKKGNQVVLAVRRSRKESGLRGLLFRSFYWFMGFLSDYPIPLNAGIFGLLDRQAVDAIVRMQECNRYLPGMRSWVGYRTGLVYYERSERAAGEPKQTFWKLLRYGLDAIFSFSYKPLRLSLFVGLMTSVFSVVFGCILIFCRLMSWGLFGQQVVVGYTSTIVAILMLAGVQLMSIGILGEYIGRIYDEVKRRPLYLVRKVHTKGTASDGPAPGLPRPEPAELTKTSPPPRP
jgi:dolichol-phosphate mannosyltransferase